jgi:PAS domain S-box-containing protein
MRIAETGDKAANEGIRIGGTKKSADRIISAMILLAFLSISVLVGGYLVFKSYKDDIKQQQLGVLSGIAQLKTRQLVNWMGERREDALDLQRDELFVDDVDAWLDHTDVKTGRALMLRLRMQRQYCASYGCDSVLLFDDNARLRLSSNKEESTLPEFQRVRLLESIQRGNVEFFDLKAADSGGGFDIVMSIPLRRIRNGKLHTLGAIVFHIDPKRFLFPLIKDWPTPSSTAENLLVRREGDQVVFLNELRHRKNVPGNFRLPLNPELPASMAVLGREGVAEGVDYRGVPVVCVIGRVEGTSWFMVSKVDKSEIYAPIHRLENWMLLLMSLLIVSGVGVVAYVWRKEKKQCLRDFEHQMVMKRLHYLSKYANDIILLVDEKGNIADFNDRALDAYGYTAEEFLKLNIFDLRERQSAPTVAEHFREILESGAMRFDSVHVRKSGETFPVESSVRVVEIDGKQFQQAIIRDITERHKAQSEIIRQKEFIRQVMDGNPNLIFVKDAGGRFLLANEAMATSYGLTPESIIGKYSSDLTSDLQELAEISDANRVLIENCQERMTIERHVFRDNQIRWFQTLRKPLEQPDGSVHMLIIAMDITELKLAEEQQKRLNRALGLLGSCNHAMLHSTDETGLLNKICQLIVETGDYLMAWIGFAEQDEGMRVCVAARYGNDAGYLDQCNISCADTEWGRGPTGVAIRDGVTQVNQDFQANAALAPWCEAAIARGFHSSIALPLKAGGCVMGALTMYSPQLNAFNKNEISLLEDLAVNLAYGIGVLRGEVLRNRVQDQLNDERIRLQTLLKTIPDMIWLKDKEGVFLNCNAKFERLYGAKEADIVGKTDYDFVDVDLAGHFRLKDRETMLSDRPLVNEEWVRYADTDESVLLETIKTTLRDDRGGIVGVLGIARDITARKQAENRESRLRHILDSTLDMIFIFQLDSLNFVYANQEAINSVGYSHNELYTMTPLDINPLMFEPEFRKFISPLLTEEKLMLRFETLCRHRNGAEIPVEVQLQLVQELGGERVFVAVVRNIAERLEAEKELRRQKNFMWRVIDTDPNQIFVRDAAGKFLLANRSAAALLGLMPNEMIGKTLAEISGVSHDRTVFSGKDNDVIELGREISQIEPYLLDDGEERWQIMLKTPLTMPDGESSVLCIAMDITQQKLSEIKLAESYRELQQLSLYLENVRADERARIALNLHDEMGATLAAIKMGIVWLASKLPADAQQLSVEATRLIELSTEGMRILRHVVTELRPNLLADVGVSAAIKDYVKKFRQHMNLECVLTLPDETLYLDEKQSLTIFYIVQEALNNVVKHGKATKVTVYISLRQKSLLIVVSDNGIGFDPAEQKGRSFGLLGIRERALMVGGAARIRSAPGKGTRVSVSIPYTGNQSIEQIPFVTGIQGAVL